jgi:hypothetical protein
MIAGLFFLTCGAVVGWLRGAAAEGWRRGEGQQRQQQVQCEQQLREVRSLTPSPLQDSVGRLFEVGDCREIQRPPPALAAGTCTRTAKLQHDSCYDSRK